MMRRLMNYYTNKKNIVERFSESREFLFPGNYRFDESLTYIHLDDQNTSKKTNDLFSQGLQVVNFFNDRFFVKTVVSKILRFYFNKKLVINRSASDDYKGTVYLPGGNGNDVKIFNFENNEVLIAFSNKETFEKKMATYKQFSPHFPIPLIIDSIDNKQRIIERYIDYKSSHNWDNYDFNFVINEIFRKYLEYFKEITSNDVYGMVTPEEIFQKIIVKNQFLQEIQTGISPELMKAPFATVSIHGDLWSSNILIDKEETNKIFFIDWELSGEMYLFYDFFVFMWNEALTNKRYLFIRSYMNGEYDDYYAHAFEIFDLKFDKEKRVEYLNIFFLNMYLRRWTDTDPIHLEWVYSEYKKFMDYVISLEVLPDMPMRT